MMTRTAHRSVAFAATIGVAVGSLAVGAGGAAATAGPLAPGFGTNGRVSYAYGNDSVAVDSVVQNNGKIIVAFDETVAGHHRAVVRRYLANGSLDTSYGAAGVVDLGVDTVPAALAVSGSKVVVAGASTEAVDLSTQRWVTIWRLRSTGELDATFSTDGIATPNADHAANQYSVDVAVDSAGRPVVLARDDTVGNIVFRQRTNGTNDPSFSGDGTTKVMLGTGNNFPEALALDATDRIVFAGSMLLQYVGPDSMSVGTGIGRLTTSGAWDTTFSGDGQMAIRRGLGHFVDPSDIAIAANGRIVVVGVDRRVPAAARPQAFVARVKSGGSLDTSFSGDGYRAFWFGDGSSSGVDVVLPGDGTIVVGGDSANLIGIARFSSAGGLDSSFSGDGRRTIRLTPGSSASLAAGALVGAGARYLVVGPNTDVAGGFGMASVQLV